MFYCVFGVKFTLTTKMRTHSLKVRTTVASQAAIYKEQKSHIKLNALNSKLFNINILLVFLLKHPSKQLKDNVVCIAIIILCSAASHDFKSFQINHKSQQ